MLKNQSLQLRSSKVDPLRQSEDESEQKPNDRLLNDIITIFKKKAQHEHSSSSDIY
jgi:hypothetical protein